MTTSDGPIPATSIRRRVEESLRRSNGVRRFIHRAERVAGHAVAAVVPAHLMKNKRLFDIWERRGYHVLPAHFYEPVPDRRDLARAVGARSELVGIDLAPDRELKLLSELRRWQSEYEALPREPSQSDDGFYIENSLFGTVDAEVLYALIRYLQPRRLYEIGSGFSTLVAARACRANERESGRACELVAFEPYPSDLLLQGVDGLTRIEQQRLQDVPIETFLQLETNDVLFIDSSHIVATGSDVCRELLEIVPRLASGVVIHVHDVFLPSEYPRKWLEEYRYFWTEQYLLQAFLAFNRSFEVLWAGHYMHLEHQHKLQAAFSNYDPSAGSPGSFWFRRIG